MTIADLKSIISTIEDDVIIRISSDSEGNQINDIGEISYNDCGTVTIWPED